MASAASDSDSHADGWHQMAAPCLQTCFLWAISRNPAFVPADCCCQAYVLDVLKGKGKGWFPGPPRPGPPLQSPRRHLRFALSVRRLRCRHRYRAIGDKGSYKGTDGCSKGSCKGNDDEPDVTEGKGKGGKMRPPEPAVPPGRPKAKAMPGRSTGQWVQCWMWMPGSGPPYAPCPPSDVIAARPPGPGFGNEVVSW